LSHSLSELASSLTYSNHGGDAVAPTYYRYGNGPPSRGQAIAETQDDFYGATYPLAIGVHV
jgi:hypothetical protein